MQDDFKAASSQEATVSLVVLQKIVVPFSFIHSSRTVNRYECSGAYRSTLNIVCTFVGLLFASFCDIRIHLCPRPLVTERVSRHPGRPCVHEQRGNGVTFCWRSGE